MSIDLLWGIISAYATLHLIALGHSVFEKSGLLNLAIDGVFFLSTGVAVFVACSTGSPLVGSFASAVVASGIGLLLAYVMTVLPISHGAVGLSMMFIGYGLGIIFGYPVRMFVGGIATYAYTISAETYVTLLAATLLVSIVLHFLLKETKLGIMIVACGENPAVATALGVDVLKTRLLAAAIGFALIGFGSSLFPLLWQRYWDIRSYTLGLGWLAFTVA
ncbi:MAG: ribose ABC transporter permease, partial [Desulfurococcaceae archaeon]